MDPLELHPQLPTEPEELSTLTDYRRSGLMEPGDAQQLPSRPSSHRTLREIGRQPATGRKSWFSVRWFGMLGLKMLLITTLAWGLVFNFSEVRGSSMEPGIHDRDRIVVDHVSYMVGDVDRGDVVVLRYPLDPSLDYIKRVIGLPGDEIEILAGVVMVNGDVLSEPYVSPSSVERYTAMRTTVRAGNYFVMGDNRRRSSDSREFGQVPFEYLRGKVRLRLWPPGRVGWVD